MLVLADDGTLLYPDRAARDHLRLMEQQRMRDRNVWLPTQAALQLSIELADAERTTSLADVIRETSLPGIRRCRRRMAASSPSTSRLRRLIDSFLTFAQLGRGRQQFALTPVQPSWLVEKAVDAIRDRLPAECRLDLDIGPDLPMVMADADASVQRS